MRIIAGEWRGRKLIAPRGDATRPTADRTRETLFNMLASRLGSFAGLRVADLFAGSGALGLEALSRGGAQADFVEDAGVALHALKANVAARKLRAPLPGKAPTARYKAARIFKKDAIPFVQALEEGVYDIAFADPPYGSRKLDLVIERWMEVRFSTILAVEHTLEHEVPKGGKRLDFGEIQVTVYGLPRRSRGPRGEAPAAPESGSRRGGGKTPTPGTGKSPSRRPRKPPQKGG